MLSAPTPTSARADQLLEGLTPPQRDAVTHERGPLLILAGAGTGKTTVITRRIAWLIATDRAAPSDILALTFTDKAAAEMEERVDLLLPYGYSDVSIATFHAFGDRILREHAVELGRSPHARVLSKSEQAVFLREHLFELPLDRFRPLIDPGRYIEALATVIGRAKDEAVSEEAFEQLADQTARRAAQAPGDERLRRDAETVRELAACYRAYQGIMRADGALDFGDQVLLALRLLEQHPDLLHDYRQRFKAILVDEFQDTNFAQFRLLQLLAPSASQITVVADDDQSIYKWRGAALSNVLKFLDHYQEVRRIVLTENFRSSQPILDFAYRLIRFNNPDRLEVKEQIDKRLIAMSPRRPLEPTLAVFDTASNESDWVARQIQSQVDSGARRPGDFAILVRTNREADLFLRALNVCGLPWQFSGAAGLFAREEVKLLLSCLKTLADPDDSLSWYHVASSPLYLCPMEDLVACLAMARRTHQSLRAIFTRAIRGGEQTPQVTEPGRAIITRLLADVQRLLEASRAQSPGQLLYRWLTDAGWLKRLANPEQAVEIEQLHTIAKFFDQVHRCETLIGNRLPELMASLELFEALGEVPGGELDLASDDRVHVLTIHKAKGLEFPVVFMVGLVQGRFPTIQRRETIELPDALIQDILPAGDYHLQEERRLFYVGMTRAKEALHLTASYSYGGRSVRKISQFVFEAMDLSTRAPAPEPSPAHAALQRAKPPEAATQTAGGAPSAGNPATPGTSSSASLGPARSPLRLDPHGADDYLTCPLKFRYSHVLRLPIMKHHLVIYGAALHKAVEIFFKRQMAGAPMREAELLEAFEAAWSSEGFLSQEHERRRLEQGRAALGRFFARQQASPEHPLLIEEKFSFQLDDFTVAGRWDRVDRTGDGVVIVDYKSSDVSDQTHANRKTRESRQLAVYALAWQTIHGELPARIELRFLETGVTGSFTPTEDSLEAAREELRVCARGIRRGAFEAKPEEFICRWCAYQAICPFSVG